MNEFLFCCAGSLLLLAATALATTVVVGGVWFMASLAQWLLLGRVRSAILVAIKWIMFGIVLLWAVVVVYAAGCNVAQKMGWLQDCFFCTL